MCKKLKGLHNVIDICIRKEVKELQADHINTIGSCCGHGKYPKTIVVKTSTGKIVEYYSKTLIPRKRKYYKKDKEGIYFIPETIQEK